jgi:lysine biosynthesis protein LysW
MRNSAVCPECDGEIRFSISPAIDQRALCPCCGSELVVIRINPTILDWAFVEPLSRPDRSDFLETRSFETWDDH